MFNFKHIFSRLMLAAALAGSMAPVAATPIYHVDIDTSTLGTGQAFLGLYFAGLAGATQATATATAITGAFSGPATLSGSVSGGVPGPLVFSNANGGGDWYQGITLGGKFSFDVSFVVGSGNTGSTFGWALFDTEKYLGVDGDLGDFFVQPFAAAEQQVLSSVQDTHFTGVAYIPEPSSAALLLMAGLALLGAATRRR